MDLRRQVTRSAVTLVIALATVVAATSSATAHSASPSAGSGSTPAITRPGGLTPTQSRALARADARPAATRKALASGSATDLCGYSTVHCKPDVAGSCTGYTSQSTPPATIRVLVAAKASPYWTIQTVPFETYVENVLPDEWVPSWDGDSLKAGAVAVKSYAWYWVTHYGGYTTSSDTMSTCFDVTADTSFQTYRAGSAQPRTTTAVQETWPYVATVGGQVLEAGYNAYLNNPNETCGQYANGYTMSQYGSQNCVEESTGNKFPVILEAYYRGVQLATVRQLRTQHDFVYDQASTIATWNPANGQWSIDDGYPTTLQFGTNGDIPTVTTIGDGFARVGVFRPSNGTWYLGSPAGGIASRVAFGTNGDVPVQAQYKGLNAPTQLAVWRPSNGIWYFEGPGGTIASEDQYGVRGDIPVPGHYTGGSDQVAIFRPSSGVWYVQGVERVQFGQPGDIPVPADYDGNGTTDIAVYRPSNHTFYVRGGATVPYGTTGDIPVVGDFTGDGKADFAVYRPSTHQFFVSGHPGVTWGPGGAVAIGAAPYHD